MSYGHVQDVTVEVFERRSVHRRDETLHLACNMILKLRGSKLEGKLDKNQSKNAVHDGMPLGIDIFTTLVDFGSQVRLQDPPKSV